MTQQQKQSFAEDIERFAQAREQVAVFGFLLKQKIDSIPTTPDDERATSPNSNDPTSDTTSSPSGGEPVSTPESTGE